MSRPQQDTVIDEDEETCPLCVEEFDLSDKNFKPCPCGYQICQFCYHSLNTVYEKNKCPNCRREYDEKNITFKVPTAEDIKLDQQNKSRKQAAAKRKEVEKREVETSSRRNLAGVRVKQLNLVYVLGLFGSSETIKDEHATLQTLRGQEYFGQYGEIVKIVVSKTKTGSANQGIGVYVTYTKKEEAALCISAVDGSMNDGRVLRAQFGTTKYCSVYLRGEVCNNKSCTFLHETGEDGQATTLQNTPLPTKPAQRPEYVPLSSLAQTIARPTQPTAAQSSNSSQVMQRQSSKDEADSRKGSTDASALPSSASWAASNAQGTKPRRPSQAASGASASPQISKAIPTPQKSQEGYGKDLTKASASQPQRKTTGPPLQIPSRSAPSTSQSSARSSPKPGRERSLFDDILASVTTPNFRFTFDESAFSPEELAAIDSYPKMIDPHGGAKRRIMQEKEAAERAKFDAESQSKLNEQTQITINDVLEDDGFASGSLALGGEPEDNPRSASARQAIQRPSQLPPAANVANDAFSETNSGRKSTPQHRQQTQQGPGQSQQNFGSEAFDFDRRSNQYQSQSQYDPMQGHQRHSSRYFNNEAAKPTAAPRFASQQQSYYSSGVQGPPPGLKTAGTPPISGGDMFAHGQSFTSNVNAAFGSTKDANASMQVRGRSGATLGNDVAKRELLLSPQDRSLRSPTLPAPAPGHLTSFYEAYPGAYQDPGFVKQKKNKGKKHRHANTSSSGGVGVDLADPSILQARIHQGGGGSGQGLFSGQNQGGYNQSSMLYGSGGYNRW